MKAAIVHDFTAPLAIKELPVPQAGPGEVVVRIETSGLCHTDIHAAHGDWPVKPNLPFIPGHEGVGIVASLGEGVSEVAVGDRVALPWLGYACGACEHCTTGWETLCEQQRNTGYSIDGSYAEYALASAKYVAKVPDAVDPLDAAPLTCAGVTTYKAVKVSGARPASLVAVFGIGGLGHLALQYAKIFGATVVAVDVVEDKLELARELGADYTVNALTEDPVAAIRALGGAHAAISVAVAPKRSSRRTARCAVAARLSSSPCPPTTTSSCRSSRPYSTASPSSARSSAPARTSPRCSGCTSWAGPESCGKPASSTRSTSASKRSRKARSRPGSSSTYGDLPRQAPRPVSDVVHG